MVILETKGRRWEGGNDKLEGKFTLSIVETQWALGKKAHALGVSLITEVLGVVVGKKIVSGNRVLLIGFLSRV